jgi:hypothetical protein
MQRLSGHSVGGGGTLLLRLFTIESDFPNGNPILPAKAGMANRAGFDSHLCVYE